jgi:uncharacterized protein (UPF0216 family)
VLIRIGAVVFLIAAFVLPSDSSAQARQEKRLYTWKDEHGNVFYGETIPPEYANRDREILNQHGVHVGSEEGEITPEERAELERLAAIAAREQQERLRIARHDRMLLETYITVADIEDLRDRRLELLESQIKVTELYLTNLRKRLVTLQDEASAFKPYTTKPDAPQIPESVALEMSRTVDLINLYEQTLARTRADQESLRKSFDTDIARFRELKGV